MFKSIRQFLLNLLLDREQIYFERFTLVRDYIGWYNEYIEACVIRAHPGAFKTPTLDNIVTAYVDGETPHQYAVDTIKLKGNR